MPLIMKHLNRILPLFTLTFVLIFIFSCSDSSSIDPNPESVPQVPSVKSMEVDLSIFASDQPDSNATENQANYEAAASSISNIRAVINRNINLALNLFEQADTAQAEKVSEGKWQWKFTSKQGDGDVKLNYKVRLVALQQANEELKWDFYLTSPVQPGGEMHYITGLSNNAVTKGTWTYHSFGRAGQPSHEMAELDWKIDESKNLNMQLQLLADNNFKDSQMNYQTDGAVRRIVLAPSEAGETTIEFNAETNAGFIITPEYNNGEKACWNSNFENTACPES